MPATPTSTRSWSASPTPTWCTPSPGGTAATDPNTGWPADNAVIFKNGRVINLGTLPGGYESQANDINDRGQVSGFASNGTADPYSMFDWGTQARSFIWQDGKMRDIATLGE